MYIIKATYINARDVSHTFIVDQLDAKFNKTFGFRVVGEIEQSQLEHAETILPLFITGGSWDLTIITLLTGIDYEALENYLNDEAKREIDSSVATTVETIISK